MSNSIDDTKELESYGVWVKQPTDENVKPTESSDLDLPDFDDMFKDDPQLTGDSPSIFTDDDDTTLTVDELANITDSAETQVENNDTVETQIEDFNISDTTDETTDNFDFTDFESAETSVEIPSEDSLTTLDEDKKEDTFIETGTEDFDFADFEDTTEESPAENDISSSSDDSDDMSEISLDDFMDEGFSDESVAAGNNGFEPGKEPKTEASTEEISLDDFMDFDSIETPAAPKEEIIDEPPLEMDISFDASADSVETEDNTAIDLEDFDSDEDSEADEQAIETSKTSGTNDIESTEVSLDDFNTSDNISTEEVDLSDFGIDSDAEETPIKQDVNEAKSKETVVDYDLSVGNENNSIAPTVNEIKDLNKDNVENSMELEDKNSITSTNEATENVSTSLLQQIIADLSGLKNEINQLKSNLAAIKSGDTVSAQVQKDTNELTNSEPSFEENIQEEDSINSLGDIPEEKSTDNAGGFFGADDTDETIALSFDELDNIMNTADFSEKTTDDSTAVEESDDLPESIEITDETVESTPMEIETTDEVENTELNFENENIEEPDFDNFTTDEITEDDLPEEISIPKADDILVESNDSDFMNSVSENPASEEECIVEPSTLEPEEEVFDIFDSDEEPAVEEIIAEEPVIEESAEDISFDSVDDFAVTEEPAVEETIAEEPLIEESAEDISFDSVDDFTVAEEPAVEETIAEEPVIEESAEDISFDSVDDFTVTEKPAVEEIIAEETIAEEPVIEESAEEVSFDSVDDFAVTEEPAVEEIIAEEPVIEESEEEVSFDSVDDFAVAEEPAVEETIAEEPVIEESEPDTVNETSVNIEENSAESFEEKFAEVDNLDDNISESNLNYLTKENSEETTAINADLKQDIKSVLLYMDQLLENLPEDKIIEFAKSEEFTTYKKLFNELGLS